MIDWPEAVLTDEKLAETGQKPPSGYVYDLHRQEWVHCEVMLSRLRSTPRGENFGAD